MIAPESDPRIRALARETSQKIQALASEHDAKRKAVYQDFLTQADAIKAGSSADELHSHSAALSPLSTEETQG